ncbi:MAG TPA: saccharopine dehydrogenase NADP-binding domain-containing protein [Gemmatimonadales bacterium]|nr:saccharopine dehydrogenase NADP-binding domain-containing protein [Gemmatimonadales bacterium]
MKALVLGCGEMARPAIADLVRHGVFNRITVATRRPEQIEEFACGQSTCSVRVGVARVDVLDPAALVPLMRGHDVVCNLAGPNYRNAVPVVRAAIAARVSLVDVSDDWEATLEILDLHRQAQNAGITVLVGLGASPGVTNVLARYGADRLDHVEEVRTSWVMRGSDLGGPALAAHLLYSLPHRGFVFEDGAMREVRPFEDGKEVLVYPELGPVEVMHIGHPEPFTLARYVEDVRYADDKATFLPVEVNRMIVELGRIARSPHPVQVDGRSVDPMAFASRYLYEAGKRMTDVPQTGALRTELRGERDGRPVRLVYAAAGRIAVGTGVPCAIGAQLVAAGSVRRRGVYPPEAKGVLDAELFLRAIELRNIGTIEETVLDWDRALAEPELV